jgi:DNA-directed RNA polymerase specialized sigma24 family protein
VWKEVQWLAYGRAGSFRASNPDLDLTIDELIQVAMITVWEASSTFDGSCKFSTYVRQAITFAMIDYVNERKRGGDITSLDCEVSCGVETDLADRVVEAVHLQQLLREIPDLRFVVSKVFGFRDHELDENNVAVRRHRALKAVDALETQV